MRPYVRPSRLCDAHRLAPRLRQEDKDELRAVDGDSPEAALIGSFLASRKNFSIMHPDGDVVGMFGVGDHPAFEEAGVPWMLASDRLVQIAKTFLVQCPQWVDELGRDYALLTNIVDERNRVHINWLRWCGFSFIKRHERFGPEGRPFLEFVRLT